MTRAVVRSDGRLALGAQIFRVALGRGGVRADKQEGDGATPVGLLPLRRVLYRADREPPPLVAVPREPLAPNDGWCDDPGHPDYNRMVRLPHPAHCESCGGERGYTTLWACWDGTISRWSAAEVQRFSSTWRGPTLRLRKAASQRRALICVHYSQPASLNCGLNDG